MSAKVLIIGGSGSIGRELIRFLLQNDPELQIIAAGRNIESLLQLQERFGNEIFIRNMDCNKNYDLREVIKNCDLVCNCAGPSSVTGPAVAQECLHAGIPYTDPSDHAAMRTVFEREEDNKKISSAIFGAGIVPGFSGTLSLWFHDLLHEADHKLKRQDIYYAAKDEFSYAAAYDYADSIRLASLSETEPAKPHLIELPDFKQTFFACSYLSEEIIRIRKMVSIPLYYHNCFIGEDMLNALATVGGLHGGSLSLIDSAAILMKASKSCVNEFGKGHSFLCRAEMEDGTVHSVSVFIEDANALMGVMTGMAIQAQLKRKIDGVYYFAEIMEPEEVISQLQQSGCIAIDSQKNHVAKCSASKGVLHYA
jgi:hypothetical protein